MKAIFWLVIGFIIATIVWKWKAIQAIYENRTAISAGGQVIDGATTAYDGAKQLWDSLFK